VTLRDVPDGRWTASAKRVIDEDDPATFTGATRLDALLGLQLEVEGRGSPD